MSISGIFRMLDPYTRKHSRRISRMAVIIARKVGVCDKDELRKIRIGCLYHDIGKLFIPLEVLNKSEPLSRREYSMIKKHPVFGLRIIKRFPELHDISKIILQHHESWDGTGYPHGLKAGKTCLGARICSLADSFDAMRTDRTYSGKKPFLLVVKEINRCSGKRYDPSVVEAFNKCARKLDMLARG